MKKMMYFICAATIALGAANCGGGANSGTPTGIQKSIYDQFQKGNYEKAITLWFANLDSDDNGKAGKAGEKEQAVKAFAAKAKDSLEKKGGLKSYEITNETISEDGMKAKVSAKLTYGNGTDETENSDFVKKDGKWKIKALK